MQDSSSRLLPEAVVVAPKHKYGKWGSLWRSCCVAPVGGALGCICCHFVLGCSTFFSAVCCVPSSVVVSFLATCQFLRTRTVEETGTVVAPRPTQPMGYQNV